MVIKYKRHFEPDYAVPPGESLQEILEDLGMSQNELADRIGRSPKNVSDIINGKAPITPELAVLLERVVGGSSSFWNNLESNYREMLAKFEAKTKLQESIGWLQRLPIKDLQDINALKVTSDKTELLEQILRFFGVGSVEAWNKVWMSPAAAFRASPAFESNPESVAAWIRLGELAAKRIDCEPYNEQKFRDALRQIRPLTRLYWMGKGKEAWERTVALCADAGVAIIVIPSFKKAHLSGLARWVSPDKAVIQLSLRGRSDDHLWFTLFHEAGHIIKHGKRGFFIEDGEMTSEQELEADKFAADQLLPNAAILRLKRKKRIYDEDILEVAAAEGIAPGIVVGRLQKLGIVEYRHHGNLKVRFSKT